jgi:hypothetical protein
MIHFRYSPSINMMWPMGFLSQQLNRSQTGKEASIQLWNCPTQAKGRLVGGTRQSTFGCECNGCLIASSSGRAKAGSLTESEHRSTAGRYAA